VRKIEIVYNRNTHRSKGYGFVEMAGVDEAKRAVEVLHDQPFMGRTLIVNGAKSKGAVDADGDPAPQENPPPNLPENEE
jgi:RNA recognition motif-containing protein